MDTVEQPCLCANNVFWCFFFTLHELLYDHYKTFVNCTRLSYNHLVIWRAVDKNTLCSAPVTGLEKCHDFIFYNLTAMCSIFLKAHMHSTVIDCQHKE